MKKSLPAIMEAPAIDLTNSVFSRQEKLRRDLLQGLDRDIVGQKEAKEAIISVLLNGLFNVYREQ